jgi:hypothetical protein
MLIYTLIKQDVRLRAALDDLNLQLSSQLRLHTAERPSGSPEKPSSMALKYAQQVILSKHSPKHSHALRVYTCLYLRPLGTISAHSYPTAVSKILRERPHT